jgi:lipocalin
MNDLKTVDHLDVARYMGTWFEIAKFPQRFEKGLVGVTANYSILPNGRVRVLNSGYEGDLTGRLRTAKGKARIVDPTTNAKLKVTFFWPFSGDYWVLEIGKDYEYAVVGDPSRRYLWILSRDPRMNESVYNGVLDRIKDKGFDISRLEKNPQKGQGP